VFNLVRPKPGQVSISASITQIDPVNIGITPGEILKLPATVPALYSDDSIQKVVVTWDAIDPAKLKTEGTFNVSGSVAGTDLKANAAITVGGQKNYANNPGFESGDFTAWTVEGSKQAVDISSEAQNVHRGTYVMHYWLDGPFTFIVSQKISGLENGTYTLSAWIQGGGGEKTLQLFARDYGGEIRMVDIVNTGWLDWQAPTLKDIVVNNGTCTIGLKVASDGGNWAFFDDVQLVLNK
jgi:arabinogalactan endo-1,4-beta-galactosidase